MSNCQAEQVERRKTMPGYFSTKGVTQDGVHTALAVLFGDSDHSLGGFQHTARNAMLDISGRDTDEMRAFVDECPVIPKLNPIYIWTAQITWIFEEDGPKRGEPGSFYLTAHYPEGVYYCEGDQYEGWGDLIFTTRDKLSHP